MNNWFTYLKQGFSRKLPKDRIAGQEGYSGTKSNLKNLRAFVGRHCRKGLIGALLNFIGHGSVEVWMGYILTPDDAEGSINRGLPFFVNMTCLNGLFQDVFSGNLAVALLEALLKAPQGGAIADWASSGMTEPDGQALMNKELIRILFNGGPLTLGEATARAKASVSDRDIRKTWILFGDPATKLK